MTLRNCFLLLLVLAMPAGQIAAQTQSPPQSLPFSEFSLESLAGFKPVTPNWSIVGEVTADRTTTHQISTFAGVGVLVNQPAAEARGNLFSNWEHGDLELELDFMMPKGSNAGVYLQGRYEIQLFDSWGEKSPSFSDVGGIYERWDPSRSEGKQGFEGQPPLLNAGRAPGLWQHLSISFQAPRFDKTGRKTSNAVMKKVVLNGVAIHQNVEITGSTRAAAFTDEKPMGPLMIQGDHGPVALRNIKYKRYEGDALIEADALPAPRFVPAIFVEPGAEPALIRGFVNHGGVKKTHTIAVGDPEGIHYTMDLRQGALLQTWKGPFIETTDMWHSRGTEQLAVPLGSVITFSGAPTVARLASETTAWPDSMGNDFTFKGYELDEPGRPSFHYQLGDAMVTDRLLPSEDGSTLSRELSIQSPSSLEGYWVRLASGQMINSTSRGKFQIDGNTYYVEMPEQASQRYLVRTTSKGQELLVRLSADSKTTTVQYTLIW